MPPRESLKWRDVTHTVVDHVLRRSGKLLIRYIYTYGMYITNPSPSGVIEKLCTGSASIDIVIQTISRAPGFTCS